MTRTDERMRAIAREIMRRALDARSALTAGEWVTVEYPYPGNDTRRGRKLKPMANDNVGWTVGDGTGHEGYHAEDYFVDGVYQGQDVHGIEPECASCAESGDHGVPGVRHSINPEWSGYLLCEQCAQEYDSRTPINSTK